MGTKVSFRGSDGDSKRTRGVTGGVRGVSDGHMEFQQGPWSLGVSGDI